MASTNNAENFMKIARIVYQLCYYTHFRADFLQTRICKKWLVFANQVTNTPSRLYTAFHALCQSAVSRAMCSIRQHNNTSARLSHPSTHTHPPTPTPPPRYVGVPYAIPIHRKLLILFGAHQLLHVLAI